MLHVCQVVANINRDIGGPAVTVPRLSEALTKESVACALLTLNYKHLGPQTQGVGYNLISVTGNYFARGMRGWSPTLNRRIKEASRKANIVHNHGLWMFPNLYARQAAITSRIPLVISPRGMLEEWSLGRSRIKKFMAWSFFERINLRSAALFHATSETEAQSLRKLGLHQPIAIIPNGVEIPDREANPDRASLERKHPELAGKRWLLFLARIHPKKGVSELLRAWHEIHDYFQEWHLILAGPDLEGYSNRMKREAANYQLSDRVTFTGMLNGSEREAALTNSDLFILPTHSENFGIAIAEALAFGLPVITTKGAPWQELTAHECGWWINLRHAELVQCLKGALRLPKAELSTMGERGRTLMARTYSWKQVAQQMKQSYEWLLGRNDVPRCIQTG
jgi:glycosyltransferase involved in cell wall biosynthesis